MTEVQVFRRSKFDHKWFTTSVFLIGGFLLAWIVTGNDRLSWRIIMCGLFVPIIALCVIGLFVGRNFSMNLGAEAVEWGRPGKMQRLRRDEVLGWRVKAGQNQVSHIEVRTLAGDRVGIPVHLFAGAQTALTEWLHGLPDFDATDEAFRNRALMTNAAFGLTEVREAQIYNHKAFLGVISGLSGMFAFWTLISGYAPVRVIAVAIPLLVCVLPVLSGGRWSLLGQPRSTLPLWHIAVWPMVTTALVAYFTFEPTEEAKILLTASGMAVGLLIMQKLTDRRVISWLMLPVNLIYAFSALTLANGAYEASPRQHFETEVLSKTSGRRGSSVTVEAWGPVTRVRKLRISRQTYRKAEEGGTLCMTLYTGALGWQYYDYALCEPKAPSAVP